MGFYTNDPQGASVFGGIAKVAKTMLMNINRGFRRHSCLPQVSEARD